MQKYIRIEYHKNMHEIQALDHEMLIAGKHF
jgi:hypothetical protein